MFEIGQRVVCQGMGIGEIINIESKELAGSLMEFYIIKEEGSDAVLMIPVTNKNKLRCLASKDDVLKVFELWSDHKTPVERPFKRSYYLAFQERAKSGGPLELAEVVRSLNLIKKNKGLSVCERKLLEDCRLALIKEISVGQGLDEGKVSDEIDNCFAAIS